MNQEIVNFAYERFPLLKDADQERMQAAARYGYLCAVGDTVAWVCTKECSKFNEDGTKLTGEMYTVRKVVTNQKDADFMKSVGYKVTPAFLLQIQSP